MLNDLGVTFWPWNSTVLNDLGVTFWPWNSTVLTDLDIYTGFTPSQLMTNTNGCCSDDGSKGRPKHVEHTCSF